MKFSEEGNKNKKSPSDVQSGVKLTREYIRPWQDIRRNFIKKEDNTAPEFYEVPVVFARGTGVEKQAIDNTPKFFKKYCA